MAFDGSPGTQYDNCGSVSTEDHRRKRSGKKLLSSRLCLRSFSSVAWSGVTLPSYALKTSLLSMVVHYICIVVDVDVVLNSRREDFFSGR